MGGPGMRGNPQGRHGDFARTGETRQEVALPAVEYFKDNKLRPELLDEDAYRVGELLAPIMTHTQLRRFYGDVLSLRRRAEQLISSRPGGNSDTVFAEIRPEFKMLRAKAYYAHKRSDRTFPRLMREFVEKHVAKAKTWEEFRAFCRHFEAVVAFHRALRKEND